MGAIRIASATLLGAVAALTLAVPTTAAAAGGSTGGSTGSSTGSSTGGSNITPFGFSITPSVIAPGGQVTLNVTGCSTEATVSSGVFDTVTVPKDSSRNATVDWDAKRGAAYTVTFSCDGARGTSQLTISGGSPTTSSTVRPTVRPTVTTPRGVRGGLGGSVDGSLSPAELATGAALIALATGGTGYALYRRRATGRRH
ncbi:hypothetical protein [Streptomyces xanthochromogenes]|uniref:Lipoprotein n=1 Tax=Streptomyces xanthochromogenes TaxID=67384 RepID=A0ABQ3AMU1_9ACTN|nr:hypothetical protein [Streptomyces xanthochromogenes]GGY58798.1 hypothetical protein GCM10010326_61850 [Streptomyces xanthochromogenes]